MIVQTEIPFASNKQGEKPEKKEKRIQLNGSYTIPELVEIVREHPAEFFVDRPVFTSPDETRKYLQTVYAPLKHEVFIVLYLDNKHRLIELKEEFRGTLDSCSVYPREVVKQALQCDAAAVMLSHNHPSGAPRSTYIKCNFVA